MNLINWVAQQGFLPHGYCFQWSSDLLALSVGSNAIIALAYFSIPLSLLVFLDKNRNGLKSWVFLLFAAFIFFCGATHVIDIITIWYPIYYLQVYVLAATAIVSLATAILIWPLVARASGVFTGMKELRDENVALKLQLAELQKPGPT